MTNKDTYRRQLVKAIKLQRHMSEAEARWSKSLYDFYGLDAWIYRYQADRSNHPAHCNALHDRKAIIDAAWLNHENNRMRLAS